MRKEVRKIGLSFHSGGFVGLASVFRLCFVASECYFKQEVMECCKVQVGGWGSELEFVAIEMEGNRWESR